MFPPHNKMIANSVITVSELADLRGQCRLTILRMIRDRRLPRPERVFGQHFAWPREMLGDLLAVPAQKNRRRRWQARADDWIKKCPGTTTLDGVSRSTATAPTKLLTDLFGSPVNDETSSSS